MINMIKKKFFFIILIFSICLNFASISYGQKFLINFVHILPKNTPKGMAADYLKKLLEEKSNGRFIVKVFENMSKKGYNDARAVEGIKRNAIQLACPSFSKFPKKVPQIQLFDLPFLFESQQHVNKFEDSAYGKEILSFLKKEGIIGLAYWSNGFKCIFNNKKPIRTPSDLAGLKFRIMPSEVLKAQFEVAGAIPIPMPFSKVYDALKTGKVDGFENTWSNFYSKKFYEVQKYITVTYHGYLGYVLITSPKFLNSLPSDLRNIFLECVRLATAYERSIAYKTNQEFFHKVQKIPGLEIITLNQQEKAKWKKIMTQIYPKFYQSIGKKYIDAALKMK
ncbi:C4-dicarboxylate-binding protein DctP [Desulfonauticus submarinus]|uniref:C4-dicarboxylate-binding protein DctP n=1 Tax=Desulfonauticus submarinus TaxID=206665 RepID=A0A1H0AGH7_9BACT|nr:DctP family TRAP transporter solute-binding subunit [Desulfonauticus submarinus]SDN31846.1 C4-dicarboxylate-binding protein DctP [Desulfonauticus submarinus]